jgi:hypothetical protein
MTWKALWEEAYGLFVAVYREAAEKLLAGDRSVKIPARKLPTNCRSCRPEAEAIVSAGHPGRRVRI